MKSYIFNGENRFVYVWLNLEQARDLGSVYFPELKSGEKDCRHDAALNWYPLDMWYETPKSGRSPPRFTDALGFTLVRGVGILVSERAREKLMPFVESDCQFLPINLKDSPHKYFVLYVTRFLNCLDVSRSVFSSPPPGGLPRLISKPVLQDSAISGWLFRLPGGRGYQFDYDFATEEFVKLVGDLGLTGFRFREDLGAKQFGR